MTSKGSQQGECWAPKHNSLPRSWIVFCFWFLITWFFPGEGTNIGFITIKSHHLREYVLEPFAIRIVQFGRAFHAIPWGREIHTKCHQRSWDSQGNPMFLHVEDWWVHHIQYLPAIYYYTRPALSRPGCWSPPKVMVNMNEWKSGPQNGGNISSDAWKCCMENSHQMGSGSSYEWSENSYKWP